MLKRHLEKWKSALGDPVRVSQSDMASSGTLVGCSGLAQNLFCGQDLVIWELVSSIVEHLLQGSAAGSRAEIDPSPSEFSGREPRPSRSTTSCGSFGRRSWRTTSRWPRRRKPESKNKKTTEYDIAQHQGPDSWNPRSQPEAWPCYGEHCPRGSPFWVLKTWQREAT